MAAARSAVFAHASVGVPFTHCPQKDRLREAKLAAALLWLWLFIREETRTENAGLK
jgi:hypothetical protein